MFGKESNRGTYAGSPNGPVNPQGSPEESGQELCIMQAVLQDFKKARWMLFW